MTDAPRTKFDPDLTDFDFTTFETAMGRVRAKWLKAAKLIAFDFFADESFDRASPRTQQLDDLTKLRRMYEELLAAYHEMKRLTE